ncbi:MAG: CPBP family intramembrane metalloprotease [Lachnospiraceae bacterium]|nr:CPBP family intramembrane metalloprotease [Lachnospiraceae bacterium]
MNYQYVLFDLDGTLTDPKEGITKCVQHALKSFGIEEKNLDNLEPFIGPPLRDSFRDFYGIDGEDTERAVKVFRERFETIGITENKIYPGVSRMLRELKDRGVMLAIASSKPQEFVHTVLKNFEIEDCFTVIVGSEKDGTRDTKIEVLTEALGQLKKKAGRRFKAEKALMVGDRKFDVESAQQLGIASAAVSYGYAPEGELEQCNPTYMADGVEELTEIITGEKSYIRYRSKNAFSKTFEILLPLLIFWAVELLVYNVLYLVVGRYVPSFAEDERQLSVWLNAATAVATWPVLAGLYKRSYDGDISEVITRRHRKLLKRDSVLVIAYAVALGLGLNMVVAHFRIASMSAGYEQVAGTQYSVPLAVGLVIYGVLTPFTEELIFRGVIYNRIRKYFPVPVTIFLSGLIFGCYHGNVVQMIYALIMGMVISMIYEHYGRLLMAPVLFHCSANVVVYILSKGSVFAKGNAPILYAVALLAVAAGISCWYITCFQRKMKRR